MYKRQSCNSVVKLSTPDDVHCSTTVKSESCNIETCVAETVIADTLTTSCVGDFLASQCISQAASDETSASQAAASVDVDDMFASQCLSETAKNEVCTKDSEATTNCNVDGLHLFLEMSQETRTSVCSQYASQVERNEVPVSCSQNTNSSDIDGLHLYLEPSQQPNSLDKLDYVKSQFSEDVKLSEVEDGISTDGEHSRETANESDILMELLERGISSQSTAGGLDTAGEEEDAAADPIGYNHYGVHVLDCVNRQPHDLRQEQQFDATSLQGCQQSEVVQEKTTCGEDIADLMTKDTVDSISIEPELTDKPCESAVYNSRDNLDECSEVVRLGLPVIVEEVSEQNVTERLSIDVDVADQVERSSYSNDLTADTCSPVMCDTHAVSIAHDVVDDNDSDDNTGNDIILDVTETVSSVDCSADVTSVYKSDADEPLLPEKAAVCSGTTHHVIAAAAGNDHGGNIESDADLDVSETKSTVDGNTDATHINTSNVDVARLPVCSPVKPVDDDEDVCMTESILCCDNSSTEKGIDSTKMSEKDAVPSCAKHDVDKAASTGDGDDDSSDDSTDDSDGADLIDSISDVGIDKGMNAARLSEKDAVPSPAVCDDAYIAAAAAADDDDDGSSSDDGRDDNGSDRTDSISDVGVDKDVNLARSSENAAVHDAAAVAAAVADEVNPCDDDGDARSDITESISDVDSHDGHVSENEDAVATDHQAACDNDGDVSTLSPRSLRLLFTKHTGSVDDERQEQLLAGEYCFTLIHFVNFNLNCD